MEGKEKGVLIDSVLLIILKVSSQLAKMVNTGFNY